MATSLFSSILNFDLANSLGSFIKDIPVKYKKAFTISLVIVLVLFSYCIVHFAPGNHDWKQFLWVSLRAEFSSGRWFYPLVNIFFGAMRLPIVMHLVLATTLVVSALFAHKTYTDKSNVGSLVLHALVFSIIPYVCTYYNYTGQTAMFGVATLFAVLSVYCASRSIGSWRMVGGGVLFALLTPATYQPMLNVSASLYVLFLIVTLVNEVEYGSFSLWRYCRKGARVLAPLLVGYLGYVLSLRILEGLGRTKMNAYQLKVHGIEDVLVKTPKLISIAFHMLAEPQDLIPLYVRYSLLALLCFTFIYFVVRILRSKQDMKGKLTGLLVLTLLSGVVVIATKSVFFISANRGYTAFRMQAGLSLLYAFPVVFLMMSKAGLCRTVIHVLIFVILISFAHSNLAYQALEVENQKYTYDIAYEMSRRVEFLKDFSLDKKYIYIQLGDIPKRKWILYSQRPFNRPPVLPAADQLFRGGIQLRTKGDLLKHFIPGLKLKRVRTDEDIASLPKPVVQALLNYVEKQKAWPSAGSVAILPGNVLLVYFNDKRVASIARLAGL